MIPDVTVIMATFNRAHFIEESLNSIQNQSWKDWECIIIDDGSTDNTEQIVGNFIRVDKRFKFYSRSQEYSKGLSGCRNMGLDISRTKFIVFFDDDDIVHPMNLETCRGILEQGEVKFCRYDKRPFIGDTDSIETDSVGIYSKERFGVMDITKMIVGEVPFASCCVIWAKECFQSIRFNENLLYAEEWDCFSRVLLEGFEGVTIDQVLYYNRKHPNSNTSKFRNKNNAQIKSQLMAAELVLCRLENRGIYNRQLETFFLRMALELNSIKLIDLNLKASGAGVWKHLKVKGGYFFYPILKPVFNLKSKLTLF